MTLAPEVRDRPAVPSLIRATFRNALDSLEQRRRLLLIAPLVAAVLTTVETLLLLLVGRVVLAFADGDTAVNIGRFDISSVSYEATLAVALVLALIAASVRYGEARYSAKLSQIAITNVRSRLLTAFLRTPWEMQRSRRLGDIQRLVTTNGAAAAVPVLVITTLLNAGLALTAYVIVISVVSPVLVPLGVVLALALVVVFAPLRHRSKQAARSFAEQYLDFQLDATTVAAVHRDVELFGVQSEVLRDLEGRNTATGLAMARVRFFSRLVGPLYQVAILFALACAVVLAQVVELQPAGVGTAGLLLLRSLSYVQQFNTFTQQAIESRPLFDEVAEHLGATSRLTRNFGSEELGPIEDFSLEQVTYDYVPGEHAIERLDLRFDGGTRIGIIGPSGGGKSTLANVIVRLALPHGGEVRVNGRPYEDFSEASWARQVAYVGQSPILIRGSIAANVRMYRPASHAAVREALAKAGLLEEVGRMPQGLDTMVGDGNSDLSGGQRQRLAIARALLLSPSLILLDEPTSALDAQSEALVSETIADLPQNVAIVVVTHRPRVLEACERVYEMRGGRLRRLDATEVSDGGGAFDG